MNRNNNGWTDGVAKVNGIEYVSGTSFVEAVNKEARKKGYASFRVYLNEVELKNPGNAPTALQAGDVVKLAPYDKAGDVAWVVDARFVA